MNEPPTPGEAQSPRNSPADGAPARTILGLVPMAGRATRLGDLPCSKEILPLAFDSRPANESEPVPVCHFLLRGMAEAGIRRAIALLRAGKWDIPAHLGSGAEVGLDLSYLVVEQSSSVPETLARAVDWLGTADVALGFPDILLRPRDAWSRLLAFHQAGNWDVSLGAFPTDQAWKADMIAFEGEDGAASRPGALRKLVIKDPECSLRWTWSIALWKPSFTRLLQTVVADQTQEADPAEPEAKELYVGDVLRRALEEGLRIQVLPFVEGSFLDIGTPEDLQRALSQQHPSDFVREPIQTARLLRIRKQAHDTPEPAEAPRPPGLCPPGKSS